LEAQLAPFTYSWFHFALSLLIWRAVYGLFKAGRLRPCCIDFIMSGLFVNDRINHHGKKTTNKIGRSNNLWWTLVV
jgi:hypothetical protein